MAFQQYPTKGGIPSGSTSARPSSPAIGDTYYNGQTGVLEIYTSGGWQPCSAPPGAPTGLTLTDVGTNRAYGNGAISVAFTPSTNGGLPSNYVAYTTAGGFSGSSTSSPVVVENLVSNTGYSIYTVAQNGFGNSTNSLTAGPVTATTVPQAPQSPVATASGLNQITLSWTIGANGGKALTGHTVTLSPGGASTSLSSTSTSATFTGLTGGTTYTATVTASNLNGTSTGASSSVQAVSSIPMELLVIAGGGSGMSGGGWDAGGGGGAGGYRSFANHAATASFTVTVGAGGAAVNNAYGNKGSNSVFGTVTATGGGPGANVRSTATGGSGGGGRGTPNNGLGNQGGYTPVEGYDGGVGYQPDSWGGNYYGAGGGGASQASPNQRDGGAGQASSITGTSVTRAGGGGGGGGWDVGPGSIGQGGSGGGGIGAYAAVAGSATANTGSGGGGSGVTFSNQTTRNSGAGGSGIIICAYPSTYPPFATIGAGLTYTVDTTSRSGYRIYTFTAGTGTVTF